MHMADALLSPAVGGTLWAATAATIACCSRKLNAELDDRGVPLMGVLGAFIFTVQMINFAIPGTGSSGHLGGGLLLAILLGSFAAFVTIASVLIVQALFFADGGLLALGCNIFNLGFIPAFIAYPLIYLPLAGPTSGRRRRIGAAVAAAVVGLQLGALGVVLQTSLSGIAALPFTAFLAMMLPVHLGIGIVEGLVTAAVAASLAWIQPEFLRGPAAPGGAGKRIFIALLLAAVFLGGGISRFAASDPDGLEWAVSRVAGTVELETPDRFVHLFAEKVQRQTSLLPDYDFRVPKRGEAPEIGTGTGVAGLVGGVITLALTAGMGVALKRRSRRSEADFPPDQRR